MPASAIAITAISTASEITTRGSAPPTIASTTLPASTGVATASTALTTLSTRNPASIRRCGWAKAAIRRTVAIVNGRFSSGARDDRYIWLQATDSMLMTRLPPGVPARHTTRMRR